MRICSTCIALFLLASSIVLRGQPQRQCATMEHHQQILRDHPEVKQNQENIEQFTRMRAKFGRPRETLIRIPVVVHVLYNNQQQNISDQQIFSQLDALNRDFQRKNEDAKYTDPIFSHLASDIDLQFTLANVDPQGNPTTGITRTYTDKQSFIAFTDEVKKGYYGGKSAWPSDQYLNIWVCNLDMGVLGFAQFPGGPPETDGVVIGYKYFGTEGTVATPFNLGRTTTHEIGHWLNLRHIWGDSPCGDDGVEDTPPSENPHHGCVQADSSCGSPDMVQNFMDYTDDACMNFFTKGQRQRMRSLFDPGGPREQILYSKGYDPDQQRVCEMPLALNVDRISDSTARLHWNLTSNAKGYEIRMRMIPDGTWKDWRTRDNDVNVYRLRPCTSYEFQVQGNCGFDNSDFSEIISFKTTGCIDEIVQNIQIEEVNGQEALISWEPVKNAKGYELEYVREGNNRLESRRTIDNRILIISLLPNQKYYFRVRTLMENKLTSFSKATSFITSTGNRVENQLKEFFTLDPMIAIDAVTIELTETPPGRVEMIIRNKYGKIFYRKPGLSLRPYHQYKLKMSNYNLPPGNYEVVLKTENGVEYSQNMQLVPPGSTFPNARSSNP